LFDGAALAPQACVIAVGSHQADARELDDTVFRRAERVVVENAATALREAGDVISAIASGALTAERLIDLGAIGSLVPSGGISVFKSVGMGWQDLAVADAAFQTWIRVHP
jgi:ornithine cyclodeaminase